MKIVYYIGSLEVAGGMERVTMLKVNWLSNNGFDVHIISFMGGDNSFYSIDNRATIHLMRCKAIDGNFIKSYFQTTVDAQNKIRAILDREHFDIFVMSFPHLENFIAGLKDGSKKIFEAHCAREFGDFMIKRDTHNKILCKLKLMSRRRKETALYEKFDSFVTLTHLDLQAHGMPSNGCVIPNPNTFSTDKSSNLDQKRVIAVGRYSIQKGFEYLLRAWQIVEQKHPDWKLDFYGADSGDKQRLESIAVSLELQNTKLNDAVSDIEAEYLSSSIFVLSSIYEGFGMVLAEAMVCGVPCVSFACKQGPAEIINHMQDGILIPIVGDYNALAESICLLIEDETFRVKIGKRAKINVARYSIDSVMPEWCELFRELLK